MAREFYVIGKSYNKSVELVPMELTNLVEFHYNLKYVGFDYYYYF